MCIEKYDNIQFKEDELSKDGKDYARTQLQSQSQLASQLLRCQQQKSAKSSGISGFKILLCCCYFILIVMLI